MNSENVAQPDGSVLFGDGHAAVVYDPDPAMSGSGESQVHFKVIEDDLVVGRADGTIMVALPAAGIKELAVVPGDAGGYALVAQLTDGEALQLLAGIPNLDSAVALGNSLMREFGLALSPVDENALRKLPAATKKTKSRWQIIGSVIGVAVVLLMAASFLKVYIETPKVKSAIDDHMRAMKDQDPERAYSLLAGRTKAHYTSLADIENFMRANRQILQTYQSAAVYEIELQRAFANDPSLPQGTVAYVGGELTFAGGRVEPFAATLEKEDGEWRIYGINIGPPPYESSP